MTAAAVLFGAVFTVAVSIAIGQWLLRRSTNALRKEEEILLGFVTGSAVLSGVVFLLLALRLAYKGVFLALGTCILIAAWRAGINRKAASRFAPLPGYLKWTYGAAFGFFTVFYFINAMAPECSADGSSYHLSFVARYLREHGFAILPYNMYAQLSQGVEMLFVHAFAFGRHSAAALVHFAFMAALALLILSYGRRLGHPAAGVAASLMFYASPVTAMDGTSAYVDVAVACILFAGFYLTEVWDESRDAGLLKAAGLVAGFAYAAKYTAFLAVPYAAGYVLWRTRKFRPAATVVIFSAVLISPWVTKNLLVTGNPVSPMMNRWLPNSFVHVSFEREWSAYLRKYGVTNYRELPWQLTVKGQQVSGQIGPQFLLIPLALLGLRNAAIRRLLIPAMLYSAPYLGNIGARFFIPPLPFWSLAIALVLAAYPRVLAALGVVAAVLGWPAVVERYEGQYNWRMQAKFPLPAALRIEPEDTWLARKHPEYKVVRMIEARTPRGARVFSFGGRPESYTTRDYNVHFQSARGEVLAGTFYAAFVQDYQPLLRQSLTFPAQPVLRLRLVLSESAAKPEDEWAVHEVRLFSGGRELSRFPEWRLTAKPNPWDVQLAFDNSPVTRWRTWEPRRDGSYIEIDLHTPQTVDEVAVETGAALASVKLRADILDERGRWKTVARETRNTDLPSPGFQGKAAMAEFKARGFDYLLMHPEDWGGKEVMQNPRAWGLMEVGQEGGLVLYRIDVPGPVFDPEGAR